MRSGLPHPSPAAAAPAPPALLVPPAACAQLEGYAAASNVRGTVFLETIGINPNNLTADIVILDCFYLGLVSWQRCAADHPRKHMHQDASSLWHTVAAHGRKQVDPARPVQMLPHRPVPPMPLPACHYLPDRAAETTPCHACHTPCCRPCWHLPCCTS